MSDENAIELIKRGDARFSARQQLDTLRHEIALNFAPWHASWTSELNLGDDFAAHLVDSTPLLLARDFIGQIGAMLRPPGKQYFWHRSYLDKHNKNRETRAYLDWRSEQMMRIMSDRVTGYVRACKQADEFFGLFGDAVLSVDVGEMQDSLRVRSWHTKDCVWAVGEENKVDVMTRREQVPARVLKRRYGEKNLHEKIKEACEKKPDQLFEIRHEVLPADEYDAYRKTGGLKRKAGQFASVWIDVTHKKVLRETTWQSFRYVVPRWVTLPGWAYAISPASTIALPDARMIQQQALAILEAAEKSVNPPLVAYAETIRGDIGLEAGKITWVDKNYDSRTGAPVEPIELGKNFGLGVDVLMRTEAQLSRAFFLDVLRMPDTRNSKSTLEVQFLIDEYVRAALPLFAPMQQEYNDNLLYEIDTLIDMMGGYDERPMPKALSKDALTYQWDNPLSDMMERAKAQSVGEVSTLGQAIAALEQAAMQSKSVAQINTTKMLRDTMMALGESDWVLDEDEAEDAINAQAEANQMQQMVAAAPNIAQVVDSGVNAARAAQEIPGQAEPGFPIMPDPMGAA